MKKLEFIKRNGNYLALILCFIFLLTAFFSVQGRFWQGLKFAGDALTSDEVSHIPSGFYYLKTGQYFINTEHPYLIKDIAGIPSLLSNQNLPQIPKHLKYENIQWGFGRDFLFGVGNDPDFITFWSRTAVILFNTILLFLVYYFLKKNFGLLPALLSSFFLAFSPNVIAHSSLVVFDASMSFLNLLSILTFSLFLKDLSKKNKILKSFLIATFFTSLTLVTKFQSLILLPVLFLGGFIYILVNKKELLGKYLLLFTAFSLLLLLFIGTTYAFHTKNMEVEGIRHQIENIQPSAEVSELIRNSLFRLALFSPLFRGLIEYLLGIFLVIGRAAGAVQSTYFMGEIYGSEGAGLTYFPVLFLTKESLGFLILLFLTLIFSIKDFLKEKRFNANPFNLIAFLFILIYGSISLTLSLQIGVRYIFPITFLTYILVGKKISEKLSEEIKFSFLFIPCLIMIILTCATTFPYYLSFFNIIGGGTSEGYKIATDSNYDWLGQDVKRLGKWVRDNNIEKIYTHVFTNVPLGYYLGEAYHPFDIKSDPIPEPGSYIAVSAFALQEINYDKNLSESKQYFQFKDDLVKRVGISIFVFKI